MLRNRLVALSVVAAAVLAPAGCGGNEDDVSLAIAQANRTGEAVLVTTECATDLEVEVQPDPAGSGLMAVSLRGSPKVGRCAPVVEVDGIPMDQQKLVDAATSQVVTISAS